jgi:hypothetical protein
VGTFFVPTIAIQGALVGTNNVPTLRRFLYISVQDFSGNVLIAESNNETRTIIVRPGEEFAPFWNTEENERAAMAGPEIAPGEVMIAGRRGYSSR